MKKTFEDAKVELIRLSTADILTASTGEGGSQQVPPVPGGGGVLP